MNDAEKLTYEFLLKNLREASTSNQIYHLDKIERFVAIINIRLSKAIPDGWEIP